MFEDLKGVDRRVALVLSAELFFSHSVGVTSRAKWARRGILSVHIGEATFDQMQLQPRPGTDDQGACAT